MVANLDFPEVKALAGRVPEQVLGYTMDETLRDQAQVFGKLLHSDVKTRFEVQAGKETWQVEWEAPGRHNLSNALGVIALALHLGLKPTEIQKGLASFQGVARRQDILGEIHDIKVIDDFAHHPTAVKETLQAIRRQHPERRLWALFEPRSNTSKRDLFQKDYAQAFAEADEVIISDVFMPEKVKDGKILNTDLLVRDIEKNSGKHARHLSGSEEILQTVLGEAQAGDVILLMSNGDFGGLGPKLLNGLAARKNPTL